MVRNRRGRGAGEALTHQPFSHPEMYNTNQFLEGGGSGGGGGGGGLFVSAAGGSMTHPTLSRTSSGRRGTRPRFVAPTSAPVLGIQDLPATIAATATRIMLDRRRSTGGSHAFFAGQTSRLRIKRLR